MADDVIDIITAPPLLRSPEASQPLPRFTCAWCDAAEKAARVEMPHSLRANENRGDMIRRVN